VLPSPRTHAVSRRGLYGDYGENVLPAAEFSASDSAASDACEEATEATGATEAAAHAPVETPVVLQAPVEPLSSLIVLAGPLAQADSYAAVRQSLALALALVRREPLATLHRASLHTAGLAARARAGVACHHRAHGRDRVPCSARRGRVRGQPLSPRLATTPRDARSRVAHSRQLGLADSFTLSAFHPRDTYEITTADDGTRAWEMQLAHPLIHLVMKKPARVPN
jgi:hypothetical protein